MKTVKTIKDDDVDKAIKGMQEWFFSQDEYEDEYKRQG